MDDHFQLIDCYVEMIIRLISSIKGILERNLEPNRCLYVKSFSSLRNVLYYLSILYK